MTIKTFFEFLTYKLGKWWKDNWDITIWVVGWLSCFVIFSVGVVLTLNPAFTFFLVPAALIFAFPYIFEPIERWFKKQREEYEDWKEKRQH